MPGVRSVSRNIDDWLEDVPPVAAAQDAPSAGNVVQGDFIVKESPAVDYNDPRHEHDEPQEERYADLPFFDQFRIPAGRPDELFRIHRRTRTRSCGILRRKTATSFA